MTAPEPFDPWQPDGWECCIWWVGERDSQGVAQRRYCGRPDCPGCAQHWRRCFDGVEVRVVTVADGKPYRALCRRIDRASGRYVAVPAPDGQVVVLNTTAGVAIPDPLVVLAGAMAARPDDHRRTRSSRHWSLNPRTTRDDPGLDPDADDGRGEEDADQSISSDLPVPDLPDRPSLTPVPEPRPRWRMVGWSGATPKHLVEVTEDLHLDPLTLPPTAHGRAIKAVGFLMPALGDPRRYALCDRLGLSRGQWRAVVA